MANSGFFVGEKSVTVIDVKMTPTGQGHDRRDRQGHAQADRTSS